MVNHQSRPPLLSRLWLWLRPPDLIEARRSVRALRLRVRKLELQTQELQADNRHDTSALQLAEQRIKELESERDINEKELKLQALMIERLRQQMRADIACGVARAQGVLKDGHDVDSFQ